MLKLKKDIGVSVDSKPSDLPVVPATDWFLTSPPLSNWGEKLYAGHVTKPTGASSFQPGPALPLGLGPGLKELTQKSPDRFFFYHKNCNDGLMSAVMAFLKYGNHYSDSPLKQFKGSNNRAKCRYIPIYPDAKIDEDILASMEPESRVYFLDVLANDESVKRIQCHVRLIDHHEVNIQRFKVLASSRGNLENCSGQSPENAAASKMCYNRFVGGEKPEVGKWADMVSMRDVMIFPDDRDAERARFVYIYLNTIDKNLAQWVSVVLERRVETLFANSESAVQFYEHQLKEAMKDTFKFKFGLDITLVNCSQVFFSDAAWVAPEGLYMNAAFRKKGVQIQLRGKGAQVIAQTLGGNGHPEAAGAFITHEKFMEVIHG